MRDYSKPRYDVAELTSAFNGICKCLGKENFCCIPDVFLLGKNLYEIALSEGCSIKSTGDVGTIGVNLQLFINFVMEQKGFSKENLKHFVDAELHNLPQNPLINYFE